MEDAIICRICSKQVNSSDWEWLEGTLLEVLEVVIIKLNFSTTQPVICKDCSKKLLDAFEHKSRWIYTEDLLFPYVNSISNGKVDIKKVYFKERKCEPSDIERDIQICRLCMKLISDNSWNSLRDVLEKRYTLEIFGKYVPELDLNAIKDPVICKRCLISLSVFMDFIALHLSQVVKREKCLEVEENIEPGINSVLFEEWEQNEIDYSSKGRLGVLQCRNASDDKTHLLQHIPIDRAKKQDSCKTSSYRSNDKIKLENNFLARQTKSYKCNTCNYRANNKFNLEKRENWHKCVEMRKQPGKMEMFRCAQCSYKSKCEGNLQRHILIHNVEELKCEFCSFKTKHKSSLLRHFLVHTHLADAQEFKCEFCPFKAKQKRYIQRHVLIHQPSSGLEMFKCDLCSFKTKYKGSLREHILNHISTSQMEELKCEFCSFKSKHKRILQMHILNHEPLSNLEIFRCKFCSYTTKEKRNLPQHIVIHKPPSDVEVFKCEVCSFTTKHRTSVLRHMLIHKSNSQVKIFKCGFCSYQSRYKNNLKRHLKTHN